MMYPARGGVVWGQMRGKCYLKSGGLHPLGGLYNILVNRPLEQYNKLMCFAVVSFYYLAL